MKLSACLSVAFAGGVIGALVNQLAGVFITNFNIDQLIGVYLPKMPDLHTFIVSLYPMLVWGGLWALLFVIPFLSYRWFVRGMLIGTLPSIATLFIFLPEHTSAGLLGVGFGTLTFLVVLILNWIWGLVASYWYHRVVAH